MQHEPVLETRFALELRRVGAIERHAETLDERNQLIDLKWLWEERRNRRVDLITRSRGTRHDHRDVA